jgi:hypothetical protein
MPKYTLEALEKLRDGQVDDAKKKLADAVDQREGTTARRQQAERTIEEKRQEAERVREKERAALEAGGVTVRDLALQDAWEIGVQTEAQTLEIELAKRKQAEAQATEKEAQARATVAIKKADAEVVHKDHDRFIEEARKKDQAKEEEAAEEAWRPKH